MHGIQCLVSFWYQRHKSKLFGEKYKWICWLAWGPDRVVYAGVVGGVIPPELWFLVL